MKRLLLGTLILLPVVEIALFIQLGGRIGLAWTLAWLALSALIGLGLLRLEGLALSAQVTSALLEGRLPTRELGHTLLAGVAAVLLIVPGFFTDFIALLLLLPAVRRELLKALFPPAPPPPSAGGRIIEGEYRQRD